MAWPAFLDDPDVREGTVYVSPGKLANLVRDGGGAGQAWRLHEQWTTYRPTSKLAYKSLKRLRPKNAEDFWRIMASAKSAGCVPPISFSDLFQQVHPSPFVRVSPRAPFYGMAFGGWEEAFWKGVYRGPVWHYDLNKAYRWAACLGLPDLTTAYKVQRPIDGPSVYLLNLKPGALPYVRAAGPRLVTDEELPYLDRTAFRTLRVGVAFRKMVNFSQRFADIDRLFPYCYDRISRAFWGVWNTPTGPERVTWRSGEKVNSLSNPFYNPIWAAYITSRIKGRLQTWRKDALLVFVDSILSKDELPIGPNVGEWKLLGQYPDVWIRGAAQWGTGTHVVKHSGFALAEDCHPVV